MLFRSFIICQFLFVSFFLTIFCCVFIDVPDLEESTEEESLIQEEQYNPTEDEIYKTVQEHKLYKDPFINTIITDCSGKTPLHVAVIHKHEDVLECFFNFQG